MFLISKIQAILFYLIEIAKLLLCSLYKINRKLYIVKDNYCIMIININLDETSEKEVNELVKERNISKSKIIRDAIGEFYLKEKRARENFLFFSDLFIKKIIDKDTLFILLPRKDAEAIIIGTKFGVDAAEHVKKNYNS